MTPDRRPGSGRCGRRGAENTATDRGLAFYGRRAKATRHGRYVDDEGSSRHAWLSVVLGTWVLRSGASGWTRAGRQPAFRSNPPRWTRTWTAQQPTPHTLTFIATTKGTTRPWLKFRAAR